MKIKILIVLFLATHAIFCQISDEYIKKIDEELKTENIGKVVINGFDEFTGDHNIQVNAMRYKKLDFNDKITKGTWSTPIFLSVHHLRTQRSTSKFIQLGIGSSYIPYGSSAPTYCVSDLNGKVIFILDNGDKIELKQVSDIKCNSFVNPKYLLMRPELEKLCNNNIEKLRVYFAEGYADYIVNDKRKDLIMSTFNVFKTEIDKFMQ